MSQSLQQQQQSARRKEYLFKILIIGDLGTGKTSIIKRYVHDIFSGSYKSTIGVDFALKVLQYPFSSNGNGGQSPVDSSSSPSANGIQQSKTQEAVVRLQLWDIAGQERFGNMTRVYYKEAVGALIVFDLQKANESWIKDGNLTAAMDGVRKWKSDLDSKVNRFDYKDSIDSQSGGSQGSLSVKNEQTSSRDQLIKEAPIPAILLGNKADLVPNNQEIADELRSFCQESGFHSCYLTSAKEGSGIDEAVRQLVELIVQNEFARQQYVQLYGSTDLNKAKNTVRLTSASGGSPSNSKGCCA
ncbi:hypothetical protein MP228_009468 [Amoeboaphelidium protococcarum]|nr:hypothetical protein MP228_009468 [Amoeboaphelidium protococcarum]